MVRRKKKVPRTIRAAVYEKLCQTNGSNLGLRYDEILASLKEEFPNCKTTLKGLRWYATTFQKQNPGFIMPLRPRRPHKWGRGRDPNKA